MNFKIGLDDGAALRDLRKARNRVNTSSQGLGPCQCPIPAIGHGVVSESIPNP